MLPTEKRVAEMLAHTSHKPDEVAGHMRSNQFRQLVFHLKLAAIDLYDLSLAAMEQLSNCFDCFRLAGASWSQQKKDTRRPAFGSQPRLIHINVWNDRFRGGRLPDDFLRQQVGQIVFDYCLTACSGSGVRIVVHAPISRLIDRRFIKPALSRTAVCRVR